MLGIGAAERDAADHQAIVGQPQHLAHSNYCCADGGTHVRLSMAADALAEHLVDRRDDTALAFLATPTDTFAVPAEEVRIANDAYSSLGIGALRS
ncbi:hypothetical protein [Aeromicrobium fastidiosum]|uniref:Uncharacterized protein n=1 Tax=Aeromicrobium fastidiosum TaxID=52699 RepID=A0A641AQ75_9ACTN|nr:hypothetical protein [Aeromicrobium fastidiosum]KAA1380254.1 hypothetical protein ESP62_003400 [Aeromicrobium fastidiosum]MBP2389806.1 hypothetical protein [Aeromicrobium fastidiosum]